MRLFTRNRPDVGAEDPSPEEKTVRIARKRFVRRQWARRWLAWRRLVVAVLPAVLVVAGVWLVFFSSVLAVTGVEVTGTRVLSPAQVRRVAAVPLGSPLATADLAAVRSRVGRLPAVGSVEVSRSWPDRVRVDVTERRAVAVVAGPGPAGVLRGIDSTGVLFRRYAARPADLPVIRTGGRTRLDAVAEAAKVAGSMAPTLARRVRYVEARTVDRISLALRNGRTVRWGSADGSSAKARVLSVLLGAPARFYDVSVPSRPVIRR